MERSQIAAAQVADGFLPHERQQEGHQRPPASPLARHHLPDRLVHVPPHPRGHARRRPWLGPIGGAGKIVEADETYFGTYRGSPSAVTAAQWPPFTKGGKSAPPISAPSSSLVERGGRVRSFHAAVADGATVAANRARQRRAAKRACTPMKAACTSRVGAEFAAHETVKHSAKRIRRGDVTIPIQSKAISRSSSAA